MLKIIIIKSNQNKAKESCHSTARYERREKKKTSEENHPFPSLSPRFHQYPKSKPHNLTL
jgi:hypothetical protein